MDNTEVAVNLTATGTLYTDQAEYEAAQQDKDTE
jgi:hypothetical protein